jgi:nucleotide-binding universal stress UspA family protein
MIIEARDDVVLLEGALEKNQWPTIQAAANLLLRQHAQGIIIDGSGVTRCSPEGAMTFRDAMNYIERYRARIVVSNLPDCVMDTVRKVPGVRSRLPIAATLEEARASLSLTRSGVSHTPASRRQLQDILVPVFESGSSAAATALACRLVKDEGQNARIHLACILEIPRHLPVTAPLPEEEAIATKVLRRAEKRVKQEGLTPIAHVTRARDAGEEIIHQAEQLGANIIVLSYMPTEDTLDEGMSRVMRTVLDRAPCEVILNRPVH